MTTPGRQSLSKMPSQFLFTSSGRQRSFAEYRQAFMEARSLRNYETSALLRLPAEIRQEIFKYVFNDLTFKMFRVIQSPGSATCGPASSVKRIKARLVYKTESGESVPAKHPLALLYTSAQLHQETSILPFELATLNTAKFDRFSPKPLISFLTGLTDRQRGAISTLHFEPMWAGHKYIVNFGFDDDTRDLKAITDVLGGLRRIVVHHVIVKGLDKEETERKEIHQFCQELTSFTHGIEITEAVEIVSFLHWDFEPDYDEWANPPDVIAAVDVTDSGRVEKRLIHLAILIAIVAMGVGVYWALCSAK